MATVMVSTGSTRWTTASPKPLAPGEVRPFTGSHPSLMAKIWMTQIPKKNWGMDWPSTAKMRPR